MGGVQLIIMYQYWLILCVCVCARACAHSSCVRLFVTPWTVVLRAPLSMGFSRQDYWPGMPCPPPGDLLNPGIEPASLMSPALAGGFFTTSGQPHWLISCDELLIPWHVAVQSTCSGSFSVSLKLLKYKVYLK